MSTATSQERPARLGVIRALRIGALAVRNLPVFVFPDEDLRFALASGDTVTIDAILGWDVIRRSHAVLDFGAGHYSLELADAPPPDAAPLFWSGYPIVRLHAAGGEPLLFGLDTGSFNTSLTDNLLTKLDVGAVTADTIPIGGVAGFVDTPVRVAERLTLRIADHLVELGGAWTEEDGGADEVFFFRIDGVLGIDIAQGCRLTVHGPGGFDLRCPSG